MCRDSVCRPNKLLTEKAGAKATDLIAALPRQYIRGRGEHSRRKVGSFLPKARVAADGRLRCTMRVFPRDASKVVDGVAPSAPGRLGQQCEIWPLRFSSPSVHDSTPRTTLNLLRASPAALSMGKAIIGATGGSVQWSLISQSVAGHIRVPPGVRV
jgi:hypothetical protein